MRSLRHFSPLVYSAGHLFEAGVAWRDASGKLDLLDASTRYADLIDGYFGTSNVYAVPGHQEIEMALIRLYQATNDRRYLNLSKFFLDQRGQANFSNKESGGIEPRAADYKQDGVRLVEASRAVGQADAQYVGVLERALYNGVLSGISLSGDKFSYTNTLASRGDVRRDESWNPACCQSNLVRIIPQVESMAYATSADTIYVNLFVAGKATLKLKDSTVQQRQETEYPLDGRLGFICDGRFGPRSESRSTPSFSWSEQPGKKAWIQCEWPQPRELTHSAAYWAVDRQSHVYWGPRIRGSDLLLPRSWRILYRDGDVWKPVETDDPFTLRLDQANGLRFKPVPTSALRLEVATSPSGAKEWWVE